MRIAAPLMITLATTASAQEVRVVTDIGPIGGMVADLLSGIGTPEVLVAAGQSPHDFNFRPSDAAALSDADHVIWVGPGLSPWLEDPLATLAGSARVTTLLEVEGWEPIAFGDDDHDDHDHDDHDDHDHEDHDEHGHDDHDEHGHDDHDHDDHAEDADHKDDDHGHNDHEGHDGHDDHAGHDHGPIDPHGWLEPATMIVWARAVASDLSETYPEAADQIAENLDRVITGLADVDVDLSSVGPVILPHDGYAYLQRVSGLQVAGQVTDVDNAAPGPAGLGALRDAVTDGEVVCVLYEVGPEPNWVATLRDGTDVTAVPVDPLGSAVEAGPNYAARLIAGLAEDIRTCAN